MADVKILEEKTEPLPGSKWISYAIEGAVLLAAVFLVLFLRMNVWETAVVISDSMQPALARGDRLLVDHRASLQNQWRRGDIVLFETPENWGEVPEMMFKRVVGLPGERVQVYGGRVYVNRKPLPENYIREPMLKESLPSVVLGPDEYYVMGDNRNNSEDSRDHGPVASEFIRGRVVYRLLPPGKLERPDYPT